MTDKVKKPNCYNCKHAGQPFKVNTVTHVHCEHEKHKDENCAWETLREWYNKCNDFEIKKP